MTRTQFLASICAIPFIGKLFKPKQVSLANPTTGIYMSYDKPTFNDVGYPSFKTEYLTATDGDEIIQHDLKLNDAGEYETERVTRYHHYKDGVWQIDKIM